MDWSLSWSRLWRLPHCDRACTPTTTNSCVRFCFVFQNTAGLSIVIPIAIVAVEILSLPSFNDNAVSRNASCPHFNTANHGPPLVSIALFCMLLWAPTIIVRHSHRPNTLPQEIPHREGKPRPSLSLEPFKQLGAVAEVDDLAVALGARYGLPPVFVDHGKLLAFGRKLKENNDEEGRKDKREKADYACD